MICGMIFDI